MILQYTVHISKAWLHALHKHGETRLHNRHCNGRWSAQRDPPSTVAQFLSSLDSNRLRETLAATRGDWRVQSRTMQEGQTHITKRQPDPLFLQSSRCCVVSRRVHWSVASGPWCSCQLRPAIFLPDICFPESCHTRPCVYEGGDCLLNKRTRVAVTALMVFTHVYSVYTLPNTCRPICAPPVKIRRWPSHLSHVINVWYQELSSV